MRTHTILIAHRDAAFADALAASLRTRGYFLLIECPGPLPPQRCVRCDKGYCPLTEGADLMIYDPRLTSPDEQGNPHYLAVESALAHPDVPMLLAWSPQEPPDPALLRTIRAAAPHIRIAAHDPALLLQQIHQLLDAPQPAGVVQ